MLGRAGREFELQLRRLAAAQTKASVRSAIVEAIRIADEELEHSERELVQFTKRVLERRQTVLADMERLNAMTKEKVAQVRAAQ